MLASFKKRSLKILQDVDQAIFVMHSAGKWLEESGKSPSMWWKPQNMNRDFLLQHAEPNEFYAVLVDGKPAAAEILQDNQRNQSWKGIDGDWQKSALYIHWLCVDREFSGRNLPKILINFAAQQAKKRNLKLLRLDTNADETKLRKIYEDLGFSLMGAEQEAHQKTAFYQKTVD